MCVMGVVKPGQNFTPEHIEQIYHRGNNDGFGLAYVEGERYEDGPNKGRLVKPGRIKIVKSMGMAHELKEIYKTHLDMGIPFVFHLRNATAGDRVLENCHPYQVLSIDNDDPIDLWMFHNGTMRNAWIDKSKSDSRNFAEDHLRGLLRERPSMLYEEGFRRFLATMIENNKLIFIDNRERVSVINHDLGSYHPSTGVWLSTKDNIQPYVTYRPPTPTPAGFAFGAGRDNSRNSTPSTSDSAGHISTETNSSGKPKITWIQPDGSKWVMSADGRSHYIPATINTNVPQSDDQLPLLTGKNAGVAEDKEFIKELIEKSQPPKTPAEYEQLKEDLKKLSQLEMFNWLQEYPVEGAYMLKYGAAMWPDTLPEFAEMSLEDIIAYNIDSSWNAAYALVFMTRQKEKVRVHEVN